MDYEALLEAIGVMSNALTLIAKDPRVPNVARNNASRAIVHAAALTSSKKHTLDLCGVVLDNLLPEEA